MVTWMNSGRKSSTRVLARHRAIIVAFATNPLIQPIYLRCFDPQRIPGLGCIGCNHVPSALEQRTHTASNIRIKPSDILSPASAAQLFKRISISPRHRERAQSSALLFVRPACQQSF